ncbi:phosphonate metabolism protein PhnM [Oceanidesulfovibrio marinus]|uniref:Phosphonate metabolism protein PhnM n=2 Tax=Oceanidesulfovibrio marinus TaxID=370038 RepID=A0A6P1ZIG9_9BACT|nr:phosphonate metabolism protein PhnM [Oceanidesulfovibrio marinus]
MNTSIIFNNAKMVLRDGVLDGSLAVQDGMIADISSTATAQPAVDMEGDYLLPGLIEMHTDNLEKHLIPRPGVEWPSALSALIAHDLQMMGSGITTVYDSIFVGEYMRGNGRKALLKRSIQANHEGRDQGFLRAEHFLHLRCELADEHTLSLFSEHADDPLLKLVSVMDHTPGQRQWSDLSKWRLYHSDKKWTDEDAARVIAERTEAQRLYAEPTRQAIVAMAHERNIPLASHDDTTLEHVEESIESGVSICEFPTTMEAARAIKERGLTVAMGAPNVVRGGSHSGNVSALDLAAEGLLDALSSDYAPKSLIHGAFLLHQKVGLPLPKAIATVSTNLADVLGLNDRGELAVGKRADLVQVRIFQDVPVVRGVWREGRRVI